MNAVYVLILLYLLFLVPEQFGWGLIFKKMGFSFLDGLIPFYNKIKMINYYKIPQYNIVLIFIPILSIYTNYLIYSELCKQFHKEKLYVIELTFFPFIYNFFLAFEIKVDKNHSDDFSSEQKSSDVKKESLKDEYVWHPKKENIYTGVYKATRNNLNASIILQEDEKGSKDNEIINTSKEKRLKKKSKICPNCGSKIDVDEEVCHLCGKKI